MRKGTQTISQPSDNFARFTNRVDELARFQQALETPLEAPLPMLFFYGVAGAGKSWLKRRMIESLDQSKAVPRASIDFDSQQGNPFKDDLRATLHEIVRHLDIVCPRFEMAFYVFNVKMGQLAANPASSDSDSAVEDWGEAALTDLLGEVLHEIPAAGVVAKAYLLLAKRLSEPARQKTFREWLKSESGRDDSKWLESASPQEINQDLCRRLGLDLLLQLPRRKNRACRAVIFLDTWEHIRRGKATGLQHYTDSEKWVVDLYGAAHSVNAVNEAFPFLQIVLFGRDHATWLDYDPDCRSQNVLEQHLVGGLSESDARNFLEKSQIADTALQESILKTSADASNRVGAVGYHAYHLGLCVDTVFAERQQGIVSTPESFDLPADKKFALTDRFLQSLDEAGRRRVTRLALTPRFDDLALRMICKAGNEDDTSVLCDEIKSYTFVQPAGQLGWFVLHPLMKSSLRDRAQAEGEEKLQASHETWRQYWTSRATEATSPFAGLAWFHHWHLDPQAALTDWIGAAVKARSSLNYVAHRQLIDWWDGLAIERKKGLTSIEAGALDCLGSELRRTSLGLPQENLARAVKVYRSALEVRTRQLF
ncbi:MAG TPA: hypothetical protein VHZ30_00315, partial [Verrucomicrobiae bacterium]|nr:hypothetical protein [Verrucomicrobiae bacterium]